MANDSNPRAVIHDLWESFVPSFTFAVLFVGFMFFFLGNSNFKATSSADLLFALSQFESSPLKARLEDLELLKLLPVAVFFSLAVALYLFDRIVLGLGHILPPSPYWSGDAFLYFPEDQLLYLWGTSPKLQEFKELSLEVERLVERAEGEGQTKLFERLDWPNKQFSKAANWLAYSKVLFLWCAVCALVALSKSVPSVIVTLRLAAALILCALFFFVALACETHYLLKQHEVRLWIAERVRHLDGAEFLVDSDRRQQLATSRALACRYSRRPFVRLSWGSVEPFRRLLQTFWWRSPKGERTSNKSTGDAPNTYEAPGGQGVDVP